MRISVLADNRTQSADFGTEHGLCVHLDTGKIKVLLDVGATDVYLRNASVMGLDLAEVDYVFISHAHRDHAGGLKYFLKNNRKAKVILSSSALTGSFHSSRNGLHDISPDWPHEMLEGRLISVDKETEVEGMGIISDISKNHPVPKADKCLYILTPEGEYVQDDFGHELALQIDGFLYTGCAHNGLMNILESASAPVHTVMGGFHMLDASGNEDYETDVDIIGIAAQLLARYPDTVFYTGHCTGDRVFMLMKRILGNNLRQFYSGKYLEI